MITSDDDGRGNFLFRNEPVEQKSGAVALAVAEPADPCGQPLEFNALLSHADPAVQRLIVGKEIQDLLIRHVEVVRIAGKRCPSEGTFAFAEKRADEKRDESAHIERVIDSSLLRLTAQI